MFPDFSYCSVLQGKLHERGPVPYGPIFAWRAGAQCRHESCRAFYRIEFAVGRNAEVTHWYGVN